MKIVTVIGARPQFIKAAIVSKELRRRHREVLIHTGQHYDTNMSEIFFEELGLAKPDYNLGVGAKSHAVMTAEMMIKMEEILLKEKPDVVLLYGDTNSTLAAALTAAKLLIPIAHVEAGERAYMKEIPEELNRIVADHFSKWCFCATNKAVEFLAREGIKDNVYNVGDVMYDAIMHYSNQAEKQGKSYYLQKLKYIYPAQSVIRDKWYLATIHRPENTVDIEHVTEILKGFQGLDYPVIFAVHPRTKKIVSQITDLEKYNNVHFVEPLSYFEIIFLAKNAVKVMTDSGGLQKECYMLEVPCVTVYMESEWTETLAGNCNVMCEANCYDIIEKVMHTSVDRSYYKKPYFGNGTASKQIVEILESEQAGNWE